jgi:hypothetical protein
MSGTILIGQTTMMMKAQDIGVACALDAEFLFLPEVLADQHSIQEMLCSSRTSS